MISPETKFKLYANLESIFSKLAAETSHDLFKGGIHINREDFFDFLKNKIKSNDILLDAGCGDGNISNTLSNYCKKIIGVDHNINNIQLAKNNFSNEKTEFIHDDIFKYLNKRKDMVDVTICSHVLEHLDNPEEFLSEIKKFTKFLFVEVPDFESNYLNLIKKEKSLGINYTDDDHIYEFDRESIKKIFKKTGLEIIDEYYRFGIMRFWLANTQSKIF